MICDFEEPINIGEKSWAYSKATCTFEEAEVFTIENPLDPTGNFYIEKSYTYGDITTILLLGFIALWIVFYVLKRIFFHDEVKIVGTTTTERKF